MKKGSIDVCDGSTGSWPDSYETNRRIGKRSSSFSCLSGAALSANATLANTDLCNGLIGTEILASMDSPKSFRRIPSSHPFHGQISCLLLFKATYHPHLVVHLVKWIARMGP